MTVPATTRRAGPFAGNDVATSFAFTFKLFDAANIAVVLTDDNGAESTLVLDSDYTITLNADQDVTPGGSIEYPVSPSIDPLPTGYTLHALGAEPYTQEAELPTGGAYRADTVESALDRIVFQTQQLNEGMSRALTLPVSADGVDTELPSPEANSVIGWNGAGTALVNIPTVPVGDGNAANVTYTPAGAGSVDTTVQARLREVVSVKDKGATGGGVVNDRAAIAAALAESKSVHFPAGTYYLGTWATSDRIFDLTARGDDISLTTDGVVKFTVNTTASSTNPVVFYLRGNNRFRAGPMRFQDLGYNRGTSRGCIPFTLDAYYANWNDAVFEGVHAVNCHTAFQCATPSVTRVSGIHIHSLSAVGCNRGACFQDQGDGVTVDSLYAERVERAYFAYGVTGHRAHIFTRENYGTTGSVNLMRGVGGYDTSSIDITYTSRDNTLDLCHVLIDHLDLLGGSITGIKVHVDIRGSLAYDPVRLVNYTGSGGSETATASPNITGDITLSGACDAQARPVEVVASYGSTRRMNFTAGRYFEMGNSIPTKFSLGSGSLYSPIAAGWGAPTPPALNNGTLARTHNIDNGVCHMQYTLTAGSTTTFGTGVWVFHAPIAATAPAVGAAYMLDNGTMNYVGAAVITTGNYTVNVYHSGSATAIGAAVPFTWASGDQLFFSLSYPIS